VTRIDFFQRCPSRISLFLIGFLKSQIAVYNSGLNMKFRGRRAQENMISGMFLILALSILSYCTCGSVGLTGLESLNHLQIHLDSGIFAGVADPDGTERWFGIPYAQPPLGPLRFKAPLPPTASQMFRNASTFGAACPQLPNKALGAAIGEDCLVLNVRFFCIILRSL
jgi:hypothetical protein